MSLDPVEEAPVQDAQSVDASKPGLQNAWKNWTSNPANNAALLQFGIAMLQPRAPGQSGIGSIANAVGEAGGAAGRATAAQTAEEQRALSEEETRAKIGLQGAQGAATTANAAAYGRQVDALGGGGGIGAKAAIANQKAFNQWLMKPDQSAYGMPDPVVAALGKKYPDIKTKGDLLANPQAKMEAFKLFQANNPETGAVGEGGEEPSGAPSAPAAAPSTPVMRTIYDKAGKPYSWDGVAGHAPVPK